jgi:hypothetical protein
MISEIAAHQAVGAFAIDIKPGATANYDIEPISGIGIVKSFQEITPSRIFMKFVKNNSPLLRYTDLFSDCSRTIEIASNDN